MEQSKGWGEMSFSEPSLNGPASSRMRSSPKSCLCVFACMETAHSPNIKFNTSSDPHLLNQTLNLCEEAPRLLIFKADAKNYKQPVVGPRHPSSLCPMSFQAGTLGVTLQSCASCRLLGTSGSQPQSLKDAKFLVVRTLPVSHHLAYLK